MKRARTKKGISGVKCERILICGWFMFLVANYTVCLFVRLVRQMSVRQWGDWEHCVQVTLWCSMKLCCVEDHLTWGCCSLSLILNNCSCLLPLALVKLVKDFLADPVWIQFAKYDNGSTLEIAQFSPSEAWPGPEPVQIRMPLSLSILTLILRRSSVFDTLIITNTERKQATRLKDVDCEGWKTENFGLQK